MNAASLELCKELWELSGWPTDRWIPYDEVKPIEAITQDVYDNLFKPSGKVPAYDLDYLLGKLPNETAMYKDPTGRYSFRCKAALNFFPLLNPADAAAALCIDLIKQGILKRQAVAGE